MSTQPDPPLELRIEKLRAEIAREREQAEALMRQRLNWAEQEEFWRANQEFWRANARYYRWQQWFLAGTFALGVLGLVFGRFWS